MPIVISSGKWQVPSFGALRADYKKTKSNAKLIIFGN